jgi:hypothetical protein
MTEPATQPNPSSSTVKPRKLKSSKEKSQRQQQRHKVGASSDATVAAAAATAPTSAAAAAAPATPKDGGVLLTDYDVEFGEFDYDAVKADEGAELWLVRAPTSVRLPFL